MKIWVKSLGKGVRGNPFSRKGFPANIILFSPVLSVTAAGGEEEDESEDEYEVGVVVQEVAKAVHI